MEANVTLHFTRKVSAGVTLFDQCLRGSPVSRVHPSCHGVQGREASRCVCVCDSHVSSHGLSHRDRMKALKRTLMKNNSVGCSCKQPIATHWYILVLGDLQLSCEAAVTVTAPRKPVGCQEGKEGQKVTLLLKWRNGSMQHLTQNAEHKSISQSFFSECCCWWHFS